MPAIDKCHDAVVRALEKTDCKADAMPFTLDLAKLCWRALARHCEVR